MVLVGWSWLVKLYGYWAYWAWIGPAIDILLKAQLIAVDASALSYKADTNSLLFVVEAAQFAQSNNVSQCLGVPYLMQLSVTYHVTIKSVFEKA